MKSLCKPQLIVAWVVSTTKSYQSSKAAAQWTFCYWTCQWLHSSTITLFSYVYPVFLKNVLLRQYRQNKNSRTFTLKTNVFCKNASFLRSECHSHHFCVPSSVCCCCCFMYFLLQLAQFDLFFLIFFFRIHCDGLMKPFIVWIWLLTHSRQWSSTGVQVHKTATIIIIIIIIIIAAVA